MTFNLILFNIVNLFLFFCLTFKIPFFFVVNLAQVCEKPMCGFVYIFLYIYIYIYIYSGLKRIMRVQHDGTALLGLFNVLLNAFILSFIT